MKLLDRLRKLFRHKEVTLEIWFIPDFDIKEEQVLNQAKKILDEPPVNRK